MRKKQKKKVAEEIKDLVSDIIEEKIDIPNKALIIDFDTSKNIFTKKRIELIEMINLYQPSSLQELSGVVKRRKQAVSRDLELLKEFGIIEIKKQGKFSVPVVTREVLVLSMKKPKLRKEKIIDAEVYVDDVNVNKMVVP